jgi:enoyl-CoA hydratase/3-hydroxyacyl-CoA dehydrogenase
MDSKLLFLFNFFVSRLADLVGFGVAVATGMQYLENFPERVYKSMLLPLMMEGNRAGKHNQTIFLL